MSEYEYEDLAVALRAHAALTKDPEAQAELLALANRYAKLGSIPSKYPAVTTLSSGAAAPGESAFDD